MNESKVDFVKPKGFTINLPTIGSPVAVRAQGDEIVILVRFTLRPRNNVMNIDLDVSARGNSAAMASLDKDSASQLSRNWGAVVSVSGHDVVPANV
jgi:hypothetical protein